MARTVASVKKTTTVTKRPFPTRKTTKKALTLGQLKKALGVTPPEVKWVDQIATINACTSTLALMPFQNIFPLIPQGDDANDRDGLEVTMKSFHIKGSVGGQTGNLAYSRVRVIVVDWQDTTYNDAIADAGASILESTTQLDSFYTKDPKYKHKVVYDKTFNLGIFNTANPLTKLHTINWTYRPKNFQIKWTKTDTIGAQVNVYRGFVGVYAICDAFTPTFAPSLQLNTRMNYVE